MPKRRSPRKGSLQFWPRKRAKKILPSVNWNAISSGKNLKGFICYKAGMTSVKVKDNTPDSRTKGKDIPIPATILECPKLKIFSVRLHKNKQVVLDILNTNLEKELKRKLKLPKNTSGKLDDIKSEEYDDVSIIVYTQVKKTGLKKKPDLSEIGIVGNNVEEKLNWVKENLGKEFSIYDVFEEGQLLDVRGLTKGKGTQGPVRRFGIQLKVRKSEKGRRRPGSIGPWHPARVTFRVPMAGQLGLFTRVHYNQKILSLGKSENLKGNLEGIKNYGNIKTDYLIVSGSVQGPSKRQILMTSPMRESKFQKKKSYEFGGIIK